MHLIISCLDVYLRLIRQPQFVNVITIDYVYMHHTIHQKIKYFSKKMSLLVVYLQPSKYVKRPLYHVENDLIILYIQEFLKYILLLANEVEVDRNQMQIQLLEKNLKKENLNFLQLKNLYRTSFLGTGSIRTNDLQRKYSY